MILENTSREVFVQEVPTKGKSFQDYTYLLPFLMAMKKLYPIILGHYICGPSNEAEVLKEGISTSGN